MSTHLISDIWLDFHLWSYLLFLRWFPINSHVQVNFDVFVYLCIFNETLYYYGIKIAHEIKIKSQKPNLSCQLGMVRARVMIFNATFNKISAISWRLVLLVEELEENHRPAASHWQTLSQTSWESCVSHASTHMVFGLRFRLVDNSHYDVVYGIP
jgi:hypothetical protein